MQDYVIDADRKQVIILDETATLYYFSYTGEKLHQMSFPPIANALRVGKMMCIHGKIWMTIEQETLMSQQSEITKTIEPWLYCFDTSFELIESRRLNMPVNYRNELNFIANPEIGLSDQYIYVQSAAIRPDYLPEDTLSLVANSKLTITKQSSEILPVRIGKRFLFSTRYSDADPTNNYIYCFDQQKQQNYLLREGIYDDFYHTGSIKQLSTLYAEQDTFYYIRQSKTLNPTLYIVRLKTS